jgi:hypothetical protein
MRKSLLFFTLALSCIRVFAQESLPANVIACPNGFAVFRGVGAGFWQVSYDEGQTWSSTIPNSGIVSYEFVDLVLNNITPFINKSLYRFCLSGTPTSCSVPDTLYVNNGQANTPQFVNPPSSVCTGTTTLFTVTGGIGGLTNDSVTWDINVNGTDTYSSNANDTIALVNFPASGTATLNVTAWNGCNATTSSSPLSITIQPLNTMPAGVAGAGSVCTTIVADPGATTTATDASCNAIAAILPSGSSPVSGTVQSCVTLTSTVPTYNGIAYVPRYYSLEPSANASTSTATVTLYFTQADFDAYNAARGSEPALPTGSSDATGIANLTISQFHGTGTTPDTYAGTGGTIIPTSVVWNSTTSLWSVTFNVAGFSGFFVSGMPIIPLPLTLTNFSGQAEAAGNLLSWQTASEENTAYFEVQRAIPGTAIFEDLGRVAAAGNSSLTRQYSYTDALASTHAAYSYRLKMVDEDGRYTYSPVVTLQPTVPSLSVVVAPNPCIEPVSLTVGSPVAGAATVVVLDMNGARLVERSVVLQKGDNALNVSMIAGLPQGVYFLQVTTATQQQTVKFVKE